MTKIQSTRLRSIFLMGLALSIHFGIATPSSAQSGNPTFKKVMTVVFENTDYVDALAQTSFSKFAHEGALLTKLSATAHPSQGNYIALTAGSTYGVKSDSPVTLNVNHIGDLLEAKGKSWKIYLEQYPGGCYTGKFQGAYVRKHNPFISFKNIQNNSIRCSAHLVEASGLAEDIQNGTMPDYSIYIPDMNNDGHDTDVKYADRWFAKTFGPLLKDAHFMKDMLLIVTFDESGSSFGANHIYGALFGDDVVPGSKSNAAYTHLSLLHTIEKQFGIGDLGKDDVSAPVITGIWK